MKDSQTAEHSHVKVASLVALIFIRSIVVFLTFYVCPSSLIEYSTADRHLYADDTRLQRIKKGRMSTKYIVRKTASELLLFSFPEPPLPVTNIHLPLATLTLGFLLKVEVSFLQELTPSSHSSPKRPVT